MSQLRYDKIVSKTVDGEKIHYGILYGNEKIVFIKTGAGGTIRGYKGKNLQMAHRVHERFGATVICASNPYTDEHSQIAADKAIIAKAAAAGNYADYEVYLSGTSDGGYYNLLLAQELPQTVKVLGINPSLKTVSDLTDKLRALPHVQKIMVYGTKDELYEECVPVLTDLACEKLKVITVDGADHEFRGMLEEYIELIDLL